MDWHSSTISVHTGKRVCPRRGGSSLHGRDSSNSCSRVVNPAPDTCSQLGETATFPPGTSKLPVRPTSMRVARSYCTPLTWWTTGEELGIIAAGLLVA